MAQLLHPVVATKNTEKLVEKRTGDDEEDVEHVFSKAFQRVHVQFQSTYSCNISTINDLNYFKISFVIGVRGKFDNMRYWGIDMNEVREIYLGTYSRIDSIDCLIKKIH